MKCFTIRAYPHRPVNRDGWDIAERNNAECKGGSSPCSFELYVAFMIMRATIPPSNSIEQYRRRIEPLQLRTGVHSLAIVSTQVYILKTCRFEHYMLRLHSRSGVNSLCPDQGSALPAGSRHSMSAYLDRYISIGICRMSTDRWPSG
jgi:hypothetical protein